MNRKQAFRARSQVVFHSTSVTNRGISSYIGEKQWVAPTETDIFRTSDQCLWDAVQEIIQGPKHTGVNCGKTHKKLAKDPWKHLVMQISESKNKKQDFFLVQYSHKKTNKQTTCEPWVRWYIVSLAAGKQRERLSIPAVIIRLCPSHADKQFLSGS